MNRTKRPKAALQAAKDYSLVELAVEIDPDAYREWRDAEAGVVQAILRGEGAPVVRHNAAGWSYLAEPSEEQKQRSRSAVAYAKLVDHVRCAIASGEYETRGTCPFGEQEVSRRVADHLQIDLEADEVVHPGGMTWSAVTMRRIKKPLLDQATLNVWMRKRFKTWPADQVRPYRDDDQSDAEAHFAAFYRFRGLDKMVRAARKAEAGPWTKSGSHGRKAEEARTESKGKIERRST